jgi:hypothetical protein
MPINNVPRRSPFIGPVQVIVLQMAQLMQRRLCIVTVVVITKQRVGCTVANDNFFILICKVQVGIRKVR